MPLWPKQCNCAYRGVLIKHSVDLVSPENTTALTTIIH